MNPKSIAHANNNPPSYFLEDLGVSILAHVALVAFLIFRVVFYPPQDELNYENAIRVDLVGLPDKVRPSPTPAPPTPKPTPVENIKEAPPPKPVELKKNPKLEQKKLHDSQAEALKRLEALERVEKQLQEQAAQKAKQDKIKGNQISPGTSLTGAARLQHDAYVATLDAHMKQHWVLPQWLAQLKLRGRAVVYLDENGKILKRQITTSSNNEAFDQKMLEAIDAAEPFPTPPDKFVQVLRYQGVEFAFPE